MGGYYKAPFHRERGVTQGNPLLPTIFNVVVETVVCHWEYLLVTELEGGDSSGDKGDGAKKAGRKIWERDDSQQCVEEGHQCLTVNEAFFYAEDELVASIDPGWIQSSLDTLTVIFD